MIVGVVSMILLGVQSRRGQQPFEFVVMGLLAVITLAYAGLVFLVIRLTGGRDEVAE